MRLASVADLVQDSPASAERELREIARTLPRPGDQPSPSAPSDESEAPRARFSFRDDAEIEAMEPPEWLWDGAIPEGALLEVHAPPESAKSFLTLGLALSIGTGRPYLGREVKQGRAVIVAAEGSAGLGRRTSAWKQHEEFYATAGVYFLTEPLVLLNRLDVSAFIKAVQLLGDDIRLIVLDTFALCLVGGDENSAKDVGQAVAAMDAIRRATGATVAAVHHVNAGGERERGSTALRGAMDTMLELKREGNRITLICSKQKDAAKFEPLALDFVAVDESMVLITAKNGMAATSLLPGSVAVTALRSLSDSALEDGISATTWLKVSGLTERTFYRCRTGLVLQGYVDRVARSKYVITEKGKEALAANCHITANVLPGSNPTPTATRTPSLERGAAGSNGTSRSAAVAHTSDAA